MERSSKIMQVSCTCLVVLLERFTPRLILRIEGVGRLVRMVGTLPVGRLPSFHLASCKIGLDFSNASMINAVEPSGARRFL